MDPVSSITHKREFIDEKKVSFNIKRLDEK